jgi:hypothetical protein
VVNLKFTSHFQLLAGKPDDGADHKHDHNEPWIELLMGVMALWSAKKMPSATMPRTNNPTFAFWFIAPTGI